MFEFQIDNSNYFDFATKNKKDVVIRQDAQLPLLEIYPIITENFSQLLSYIDNMVVTFSMFDSSDYYKILDKPAKINLDTPLNILNDKTDTCREILDFTIQYLFTEKDLSKAGIYTGEFKIVFSNNEEEKTLIVPIQFPLKITVLPSNTKLKVTSLPTPIEYNAFLLDNDGDYLLIDEDYYLILD
jgi:hypothetical protein